MTGRAKRTLSYLGFGLLFLGLLIGLSLLTGCNPVPHWESRCVALAPDRNIPLCIERQSVCMMGRSQVDEAGCRAIET